MGELDFSLGSILLGTCFNTFLYGVVVFQYARYTIIPFRDPSWLKILVAFLFMMDTVHSASVIYMLYAYCVKKFGDEQFLNQVVWPYPWTVVQWAVICCATQNVLAFRIYRLNRNKALFAILSLASAVVFGLGTIVGIRSFILAKRSGYRELKTLRTMVAIWLGFQVATDLTINGKYCLLSNVPVSRQIDSGYLAFLLSTSRTGFPSTDRLVNRLIKTAIQSGFFCSLFAIGDIIAFATRPTTSLYGIFAIPIGRIYTNALMDTLLVREKSSSPVTYDSTGSKYLPISRRRQSNQNSRSRSFRIQVCEHDSPHQCHPETTKRQR
ncbi:hypothetical protein DL96DRAFT_1162707 [Flagelloscypha sp. PMI_526]|nr:hypothetical protein DL96DRAFT_1162707 [Flagelloscypha sp. PMI_526]